MAVESVTFSEGVSENHTTNVVFNEVQRGALELVRFKCPVNEPFLLGSALNRV